MNGAAAAFVSATDWEHDVRPLVPDDDCFIAAEGASEPSRTANVSIRRKGRLLPHSIFPLWQLGDRPLARPIVVTIEDGEGEVVINCASLHMWGAGKGRYEALEDFRVTFWEVVDSYSQTPEGQMSEDAKEYLRQLRSFLPANA
jgi:hypothetical protein